MQTLVYFVTSDISPGTRVGGKGRLAEALRVHEDEMVILAIGQHHAPVGTCGDPIESLIFSTLLI